MAPARRVLAAAAAAATISEASAHIDPAARVPAGLDGALQEIAETVSQQWNCSVSIAFQSRWGEASAAAGVVDFSTGRKAEVTDPYAWGSVTKVLTGSSILRLVSQGKFSLDDEVAPLVDPIIAKMAKANPNQGFSSLADLWGKDNVTGTTLRKLLGMTADVPDFDTANPCEGSDPKCVPDDSLRALLYAHPEHGYAPQELMNVSWVRGKWTKCVPRWTKVPFCYSSTNFMLLGLILAEQAGKSSWLDFDQGEFLPNALQGKLRFSKTGAPKDFTHVHGYDRTSYNVPPGQHNDHDNWEVKGVFSGWSASDIVASAADIARFAFEVYGPPHSIAPKSVADLMIPGEDAIYGLATHNLTSHTGHKNGSLRIAYGHLGATYGYQSIVAYFPSLRFTIAVATNIETDYQQQPAHALCLSFNKAASLILRKPFNCSFTPGSYYGGGCKCEDLENDTIQKELVI